MCSAGTVMKRKPVQRLARARWRRVLPQQVRADFDRRLAARRVVQVEAELVQRVLDQWRAGHQQHAGLGEVAEAADDAVGHRVDDEDGVGDLAPA